MAMWTTFGKSTNSLNSFLPALQFVSTWNVSCITEFSDQILWYMYCKCSSMDPVMGVLPLQQWRNVHGLLILSWWLRSQVATTEWRGSTACCATTTQHRLDSDSEEPKWLFFLPYMNSEQLYTYRQQNSWLTQQVLARYMYFSKCVAWLWLFGW